MREHELSMSSEPTTSSRVTLSRGTQTSAVHNGGQARVMALIMSLVVGTACTARVRPHPPAGYDRSSAPSVGASRTLDQFIEENDIDIRWAPIGDGRRGRVG